MTEIRIHRPDGNFRALEHIEADIFRAALRRYGGSVDKVGAWLGIGRSTVYRKCAELSICLERPTRCPAGHEFTPEKTFTRPGGSRACRTCRREQSARYRATKREGSCPSTL